MLHSLLVLKIEKELCEVEEGLIVGGVGLSCQFPKGGARRMAVPLVMGSSRL